MSALIALMKDEDLTAVFENVFMESAAEILAGLSDEDLEKVAQYVAMLKEKKVKSAEEAEISEALVPILEYNAALYGTFLYESVEEELNEAEAKKLLETVREHFGREFIIEAMSPENKARLKKAAKIAGGVGAAGLAAGAAYTHKDEIGDYAKKGVKAVKKALNIGDDSGAKVAGDRPNTTAAETSGGPQKVGLQNKEETAPKSKVKISTSDNDSTINNAAKQSTSQTAENNKQGSKFKIGTEEKRLAPRAPTIGAKLLNRLRSF